MKKVYADPKLHYSQNSRFVFPAGFSACGDEYVAPSSNNEVEEEAVEGIFD
jgi:hypothetical protein